jgi:putative transposase
VERWISREKAMELMGLKRSRFDDKARSEGWMWRPGERAANGKRRREFLLSSLPEKAQLRYAEQFAGKPAAIIVHEEGAPERSGPEAKSKPRKRVIVPEKLKPIVERKLEAIAPLKEYHGLRAPREQLEFLRARGAKNFVALADQAAAASGDSTRTLLRWLALYKAEGEPGLAGRIRADRGKSRYFEEHGAAAAFVQNAYLTEGLNILHIRDTLARRWAEIGEHGDTPSRETIRLYLRSIPKPVATLAREGEEKFTAKCGPHIIRAEQPVMKWWISDHRVHDVFVYNTAFAHEEPGKAYRLWLTAVYDWGSRKIMGCVWSPTPSSQTINSAVRMGIAQAGFPQNLYWDNGKDFQAVARALTVLLEAQHVSITNALPFHPRSKPIESYFTRWSFRFDKLFRPAYAGNKPSNCPPECREAQKLHAQWLAGKRDTTPLPNDKDFIIRALQFAVEYNDTPLESLRGRTPNQAFDEQYPVAQREPVDRRLLDRLFWRRDDRKLLAGGCAELDRVRYEPTEEYFAQLAMMCGRAVTVCRDPYDMGEAIALDAESGEFLGELRIQERIDQAPQGRITQDSIRAAMRRERGFKRLCAQYQASIEAIATGASWKPEREALLDRARGIKTGTDGREILRGAAPGSGDQAPRPLPARLLPESQLTPAACAERDAHVFADLFEDEGQKILRGAAPGANASAPQLPAAAQPQLAPAFVSDGVEDDDDFGPVELEK